MKRFFYLFLSTIVISSFFNLSQNKTDIYKESSNSTTSQMLYNHKSEYNNYMKAYFDNLTTNFPKNTNGSCGFVALGMIFSYYDNFISDDIIPEKFDVSSNASNGNFISFRSSPGVYRYKGDDKMSSSEQLEYIQNSKNEDFQSCLLSYFVKNSKYDSSSTDNTQCGSTILERKSVAISYCKDNNISCTIDLKNPIISNSSDVRKYTIEKIKEGYPVLLGLSNGSTGHAVVAYEYNETKDEIYCHFGWNGSSTRSTPESEGYTSYKNAMILKINQSHSHTNNYTIGDKSYCYCSHNVKTYKIETHTYDSYISLDNANHKCVCECGDYIIDKHKFKYSTLGKYYYCEFCSLIVKGSDMHVIMEVEND